MFKIKTIIDLGKWRLIYMNNNNNFKTIIKINTIRLKLK